MYPAPMSDDEILAKLRSKPASRVCREAARRLEELLRERPLVMSGRNNSDP